MLLGRTASGLYWMHRYIERAENIARIVDAGLRMALTRTSDAQATWSSVVVTSGTEEGFREKHDAYTAATVSDYLLRDGHNPSSVLSCIEAARSNARMVRTALTRPAAQVSFTGTPCVVSTSRTPRPSVTREVSASSRVPAWRSGTTPRVASMACASSSTGGSARNGRCSATRSACCRGSRSVGRWRRPPSRKSSALSGFNSMTELQIRHA